MLQLATDYTEADLLLIAAAVVPAVWLMIKVYRADRLEKEPTGLLLSLLALGVFSTTLASLTEQLGDIALSWFYPEDTLPYDLIMYFVIVAFSEEGFKYLLLKLRTWRSPHFDCQFDGVVYAVFVSLGFALFENIGYVLMYGLGAALMRAITAVPGHASFGVFMGAYYGMARRSENLGRHGLSVFFRVLAVLIPTLIHGMYDYIAVTVTEEVSTSFIVFVIVVFVLAFVLIRQLSRRDEYIA